LSAFGLLFVIIYGSCDREFLLNSDSVKNLVASCRDGDKSAYAALVKAYSGRVFAICLGMLGNSHDAEDVAQQALVKGFSEIKHLRDNEQFAVWIVRIARNLCIDLIRRRRRERNAFAEGAAASKSCSEDHPELEAALAELREEYRLPLMLYYFDGHSIRNIAETLEISEAAAQARLSRARKQLRELLQVKGGA
jgi:RNA polymerase sigma-70 factor (ECF subfamily)